MLERLINIDMQWLLAVNGWHAPWADVLMWHVDSAVCTAGGACRLALRHPSHTRDGAKPTVETGRALCGGDSVRLRRSGRLE